jgi:hypothetical protein
MRTLSLLFLFVGAAACTTIERRYYSRPEVEGGLYYREVFRHEGLVREPRDGGDTVHVVVDGLRISFTAQNEAVRVYSVGPLYLPVIPWSGFFTMFGSDPEEPPSLPIALRLHPMDPDADRWSFDPTQVRARSDGGPWLESKNFPPWTTQASPDSGYRTIRENGRFLFWFDTPGFARHTFEVKVDGLRKAGRPVPVPPFTLERETDLGFFFYPEG